MHRDRGLSFWDFVPVVGSVRNLKHSSEDFSDGNNIQGLLNLGLGVGGLALDVMTFGSASLLRDGIKIGVKKGAEKIIITKSAEIGLKVLGTTTAGYAVKSVASPVINGTCDVVREEFNNYNRNSNGRSNRNNNDNTKKESSNDRKTTNTESSGANASNTKSSNNSGSNSNNNNNNNNNNPRKNSGTNTTQNRRDETLAWFKSLQITGIDANRIQDHELDRLAKVRIEMMTYENGNAGFMDRAVDFARFMRPTSVSRFCSFVNFFAIRFRSERDTQMQKSNLTLKKAGENALNGMTNRTVQASFDQSLETVRTHQMAYNVSQRNPHPDVNTDLNRSEIIQIVRKEAKKRSIRFGSEEAATYHMKKHPMSSDDARYVELANVLIENPNADVKYKINDDGSIDIEFTSPAGANGYLYCVILITNGKIILKTFFTKRYR